MPDDLDRLFDSLDSDSKRDALDELLDRVSVPGMEKLGGAPPGMPKPPTVAMEETSVPSLAQDVAAGVTRGAANTVLAVPRALSRLPGGLQDQVAAQIEAQQRRTPRQANPPSPARAQQEAAKAIERATQDLLPAPPITGAGKFSEMLGSTVPYLASGVVGPVGPAALGVLGGTEEALSRADQSGKLLTPAQRALVGAGGAAIGSTEAIPLGHLLGRLKKAGVVADAVDEKKLIQELFPSWLDYLKSAAKQAAEEGAQEGFSGVAQDALEASYGGRPLSKVGENLAVDVAGGAGVGAVLDLALKMAGSRLGRSRLREAGIDPDRLKEWHEAENKAQEPANLEPGAPVKASEPQAKPDQTAPTPAKPDQAVSSESPVKAKPAAKAAALNAIRKSDKPVSKSDLVDALEIGPREAGELLEALAEEGFLVRGQQGQRKVYSLDPKFAEDVGNLSKALTGAEPRDPSVAEIKRDAAAIDTGGARAGTQAAADAVRDRKLAQGKAQGQPSPPKAVQTPWNTEDELLDLVRQDGFQNTAQIERKYGAPYEVASRVLDRLHAEKPAEAPRPDPETPRVPKTEPAYGRDVKISIPGEDTSYPARYAIRELEDTFPSHNPISFQANPEYEFENDRDYNDPQNAARVLEYSTPERFNPDFLVADNPTAEHGPSVVDPRGNALGGNNRLMTLNRIYRLSPPAAQRYREALEAKASQFGIDPAQISRFRQPVLVRERATPVTEREITDYNKKASAALRPGEQAVTDGNRLSARTIGRIVGKLEDAGEDGSLADALRGDSGAEIIESLISDGVITDQERAGLIDERGALTQDAKSRIGKALVGRMFESAAQYNRTSPELRAKLERIAPHVARVEGREGWALTKDVREALDVVDLLKAHGAKKITIPTRGTPLVKFVEPFVKRGWLSGLDGLLHTEGKKKGELTDAGKETVIRLAYRMQEENVLTGQGALGKERSFSPRALAIARTLRLPDRAAVAAFRRYANDESYSRPGAQGVMFTPPTREEAFRDAFEDQTEALASRRSQQSAPDAVSVTFRPGRRGEPGTIYGNTPATNLIAELAGMEGSVTGGNVVPHRMLRGLREAQWRIRNGGLSGRERSDLRSVVVALKSALDSGRNVVFVRKGPMSDVKATLRHERFHEEQRQHAGFVPNQPDHIDTEQFFDNELAQRAGIELLQIPGYGRVGDNVLAAEIGAYLAEGPTGWDVLGLTEEEAQELAYRYARALIDRHGPQVVFKFRSISPILREVFYGAVSETSGKANRPGQGEHAEAVGWARRFLSTRAGPTDSRAGQRGEASTVTPGREIAPQTASDQRPAGSPASEGTATDRSARVAADARSDSHTRRTRTPAEEAAGRGGEGPQGFRPGVGRDLPPEQALASRRPRDNRTRNLFESLEAEVNPSSTPATTAAPPAPPRRFPQQAPLFTEPEEQASREAAQRDRERLQKAEAQATFASPLTPSSKRKPGRRPAQWGTLFDDESTGQASLFSAPAGDVDGAPADAKPADAPYKYASTQVNLPEPVAKRIREAGMRIPNDQLAEDGRESQPHITIKYGLHGDNPEAARRIFEGYGPIRVKLGKASLFENDDADVLKLDVHSEDLARLNQRLREELANTETHPGAYKPHVTIAYLKPGAGRNYAGKPVPGVSGVEITFDRVAFSKTTGEQVEIPLATKEPPSRDAGEADAQPPFAKGDLLETRDGWKLVVGHEDGRALVVDASSALDGRTSPEDATFAPARAQLVASLGETPQLSEQQLQALEDLDRRNPQWGGSLADRVRAFRSAQGARRTEMFWDIVTGYPRDLIRPILKQARTADSGTEAPGAQRKIALTGDTYRHRNQIRMLGGKWNALTRAWIVNDTPTNRAAVRRISPKIDVAPFEEGSRQSGQPGDTGGATPSRTVEVQTGEPNPRTLEMEANDGQRTEEPGAGRERRLDAPTRQPALAGDRTALEDALPEELPQDEEGRDAEAVRAAGSRPGDEDHRAVPRQRDESGTGARTRDGGVEGATRLAPPGGNARFGRDYRIPSDRQISGSPATRYERNVAAIRVLRQLEAENRLPTPEEQDTLAGYVGWGAAPQVFAGSSEWQKRQDELRALLSPEEYEHARRSTTNAHYTSDTVVKAMWAAMEHLGAKPGMSWLEPAVGVGNFLGLQPASLLAGARRVGVDKDTITGKIAQKLYPDSGIEVRPFEEAELPADYFDAAISNVPFGDFGVHDPSMKNKALTGSIHNYFFAKSLQYVRPGGIIAFVTSRYTMDGYDKAHAAFREWMDKEADFLGAVRLPGDAFQQNAGTKVVTDIVFLRRRLPGAPPASQPWLKSESRMFRESPGMRGRYYSVNEYYTANPSNILGRERLGRGQFSDADYTVEGRVTEEQLTEALRRILPADAFQAAPAPPQDATRNRVRRAAEVAGSHEAKVGALFFDEATGALHRKLSKGAVEPVEMPVGSQVRLKRMLAIRDTLARLLDAERNDKPFGALRDLLNHEYDTFKQRYGYISSRSNVSLMEGDPDQPLLLALEAGWDGKKARKARIFSERVLVKREAPQKADSAQDALMISLNETGTIDWERMRALTGKDADALRADLAGVVFEAPGEGVWQTAEEYLSGPVRSKLREARKYAKVEPRFEANVKALEAVQPEDIAPGDIAVRLGVTWVPKETYADFIRDVMGMTDDSAVKVDYAPAIGMWNLHADWWQGTSTKWGTDRMTPQELLDHAFNMKRPKVYDEVSDGDGGTKQVFNPEASAAAAAKLEELQQRFQDWLFGDEERASKHARLYNDLNNDLRLRTFDGSHLTLPGMAVGINLHPHQKSAIWRGIVQPNALLAHAVGAGKTYEMIGIGMELKRMGLISRPMYLVPNATLTGWQEQFAQMYPGARVLVFSEKDLEKKKRQQIMARIAMGNWDAVVVPHSSFQFLPVSDALFEEHYRQLAAELDQQILEAKETGMHSRLIKRMEKAKERLLQSLKDKRKAEKQDRTVSWEQLGIDQLFVDESHEYKKLGFATKQSNVAGIDQQGNQKTFDLRMKMTHVQRHGRGVTFATGTPITNTMGEMFSIMRYLIEPDLRRRGMGGFDEWSANFGRTVSVLEPKPEGGGYRLKDRFAKFVNLPELITLFRSFADVVTSDMLHIARPKVKEEMVVGEMSEAQEQYLEELQSRAVTIRNDPRKALPDNMLAVFGDATKMALDIRLARPDAPDHPNSRLNLAAGKIYRHYQDSMRDRGTQLVFMDLGIPDDTASGFSTYDALIEKLVERGIPRGEIAYIHQAKTKNQRQSLFDQVRHGRVRVLIGSTGKMGVGVNVQDRIVAMHHLDLPHRPADYEQRNGRGIRQGNKNQEVSIYTYLTAGTLDELRAASLARKASFIAQVMQGKSTVREADDVGGMVESYQAFQAATSKDPRVKRKMEVDAEVARLSAIRASWANQRFKMRQEAAVIPLSIERYSKLLEAYEGFLKRRDDTGRVWEIGGARFEGEGIGNEVGAALQRFWAKHSFEIAATNEPMQIATAWGFPIKLRASAGGGFAVDVEGLNTISLGNNPPDVGTVRSVENMLKGIEAKMDEFREDLERVRRRGEEIVAETEKPWPQQAKLDAYLKEQSELTQALEGGDSGAALLDDAEEITDPGVRPQESEDPEEDAEDAQEVEPGPARRLLSDTSGEARLDFGVELFRAGITKFADWARRMVARFGEAHPKLYYEAKKLWQDTRGEVGDLETGPHGPIFREFYHDARGAIEKLRQMQTGEAVGALSNPELDEDVTLIWGQATRGRWGEAYGLAKIAAKHGERILDEIPEVFPKLRRVPSKDAGNNLVLEGAGHKAVVTTEWRGNRKVWLLTFYEKPSTSKGLASVSEETTGETTPSPEGGNSKPSAGRTSGSTSSIEPSAPGGNPPLRDIWKDESGELRLTRWFTHPPQALQKLRNPAIALGKALKKSVVADTLEQVAPLGWRIEREGQGAGKPLMAALKRASDMGEVSAGKRLVRLMDSGLDKLSREERFNLLDVLEGRADPLNADVLKAYKAARALLDEIAAEAEDLEVLVHSGNRRVKFEAMEDYYPHMLRGIDALKGGPVRRDVIDNIVRLKIRDKQADAEAFLDEYIDYMEGGANRPNKLLDHMVRTGQADNTADALAKLQRYRSHVQRHGSIEYAREVNLPFYDPDPKRVLPTHVVGSSIRLAQVAELGQDNQVVNRHVKAIADAGGNADWTRRAVDKIIGFANGADEKEERISRALRSLQGFKLGMAAIPNATQTLNTLLETDLPSVAKGIRAVFTSEGRRFAVETGATLDPVLHESVKELASGSRLLERYLKAVGFSAVERANRIIAANAGAAYSQRLLADLKRNPNDKRARVKLTEMGIDADAAISRGKLSADDVLMAGKKIADVSQFRARPEDLPEFASTPWGKVFFQFKSFAYQQTRFMKRSIADEFAAGHFGRGMRNLLILATLFPLAGEAVKSLRDWLTGRERESEGVKRYFENIAAVGALGLLWDLIEGAQRRKLLDTVAGPSAGMAADFGEIALSRPLDAEAWKKFAYRHAPLGAIGRNVIQGRE